MRWFFIWIMFLPLGLYAQPDIVKINAEKGCDCEQVDGSNIQLIEESVNTRKVSGTLAACYFHCIGVFYYNDVDNRDCLKSIKNYEDALALRKENHREFVWKSYYVLGMAYNDLNMHQKSQSLLQIAHNTQGIKRTKDSIDIFRIMANNLFEIGELRQAENYAIRATQIETDELWLTADAFNNLAEILGREEQSSDNKKRAVQSANTAIHLYKEAGEEEHYIAQALNNKAVALSWLERYDEAVNVYNLALNIYDEDTEDYTRILNNKGGDLSKKGNYQAAKEALLQSLKIKNDLYKKTYTYPYAANHENLAENYEALQDIDKALNHYQLALQNLTNNFRQQDIQQNPKPSDSNLYVYNKIDLIRVLHLKANAAFKKYQQTDDNNYLILAEKIYNTAFDFHNQLPQQITTQESRLFQAKVIVPFIENALAIAYELQQTQQQAPETAYRFMEKNKATVLLQAINENRALQYAGLPDSLLNQEKELRESITAYRQQLNDARQNDNEEAAEQYEALVFEQKNTYDQLVRNLENNHPEYYKLKYKQNTTTLKDAQNYLDNETALLEYFVGDSSVYVLAIEKNTARLHRLDKPENWNKTLNDFRTSISDANTGLSFQSNAHQLYQWLIEPLGNMNHIKRLQIIPDAQLNYLPFGLLLDSIPANPTYQNLPYLLKNKFISYAYSTTLLLENQQQSQGKASYLYGGFAPKYDNVGHNDLPDGRENVKQQAAKFKGKSFLANQATKKQFIGSADQFQILHLSMHGILNDENPLYSKLIFANNESLHAADLYNTRLNADLAILSACNTGTGEIKKGEGVMSLSRAFTYAGCPSLLMSLWSVPDGGTATVVNTFLEQLQQGKTKDEALQTAQLKYLDNTSSDRLHPMYWAGFVPSGDMQVVKFNNTRNWWWAILLLVCVVLYFGRRIVR